MEENKSRLLIRLALNSVIIILALIFIYAGALKAWDAPAFYRNIRMYHLMPEGAAWYVAHYLPWLEIITGAALLWKRSRCAASFIISGSLLVFMLAILSAWMRGLNIDCGCFGETAGKSNYYWVLSRDLLMLAAALYLLRISWGNPQIQLAQSKVQ